MQKKNDKTKMTNEKKSGKIHKKKYYDEIVFNIFY